MRLYSAVVESYNEYNWDYPFQATQLVWSLTELAGVSKSNIILHHIGEMPDRTKRLLEPLGVEIVIIERFPGHPWCNKLNQFPSLASREFDDVVILDCDCIVLEPPPTFKGVTSKPVDFSCYTPLDIVKGLCNEAGVNYSMAVSDVDGQPVIKGYSNGGVYVIDREYFDVLTKDWEKWARYLFFKKNRYLKEHKCITFVDQMSFIFSLYLNNIPYKELDRRFNCPPFPAKDCVPSIIHYHDRFDDDYMILPTGRTPLMDAKIMEVNRMMKEHRLKNNQTDFFVSPLFDPNNSYHSHMW